MNQRKHYLLNYIFIFGTILLFLNDHIFKWEFSNWVTGKLSDFVGLLVFPFFLTFLFPKAMKWNVILTGLFFIFWKSPFSEGFIELYNAIAFIEITRVVDYSDLIALSVLPLSYYLMTQIHVSDGFLFKKIKVHPLVILLPSVIVFMATSPPHHYYFKYLDGGNLKFGKYSVNVKMRQESILEKLHKNQIEVYIDTLLYRPNLERPLHVQENFYRVNQIIIEQDTLNDLQFSMIPVAKNKTKIFLISMNISEDIQEAEVKGELRKYYRKLLKRYIKNTVKY